MYSLAILALAVVIVVSPDPYASPDVPITVGEAFSLTFLAASVAGLAVAWRWEFVGGVLAVAGVFGSWFAFCIDRGEACFDPTRFVAHNWLFLPGLVLPGVLYVWLHLRSAERS